ncbi:MAG: hypothetical protein JXA99_10265 [Candidatus Lokiarchaeota archaeon]|nr:hypothetical protein [Candidatus Lokiarchaeota archaeon]
MNIALAQIKVQDGEKEKNLAKVLSILDSLRSYHNIPDIVCFPELFTTGYDLKNVYKYAEDFPGETLDIIKSKSQNNFIVIGSILEKEKNLFFNTAFILGKDGSLLGKYRKTHLFQPMQENEYLTPGDSINTFTLPDLNNLKIGLAICYDLRFPELFRKMALQGAKLIFLPSEFPSPKSEIWKILIKARAIENQLFMIGINRVGKANQDSFFGNSIITDGDSHKILGKKEEIKMFNVNINKIDAIREILPIFDDRRTDIYKIE